MCSICSESALPENTWVLLHESNPDHIRCAGRSERDACHNNDALRRMGKSFCGGELAGAGRHIIYIAGIFRHDGVNAPGERKASRRVDDRRQCENWRFWALARNP
jgi:hypothetical protein